MRRMHARAHQCNDRCTLPREMKFGQRSPLVSGVSGGSGGLPSVENARTRDWVHASRASSAGTLMFHPVGDWGKRARQTARQACRVA